MFTNGARWAALGFGGFLVVSLGTQHGSSADEHYAMTPSGTVVARLAQDSVPPQSAALLRRLAAAADGYRTGAPVYVVASYEYPYTVVGVVGTRDSAALIKARAAGRYTAVFGPYVTPPDFGRASTLLLLGHIRPTVWLNDSAPTWREQDIDSVAVTVYHRSRGTWRKVTHGLDDDAMFFTLAAVDKFALPYYAQLYSPAYADSLRQSLGAYIRGSGEH